MAGHIRRKSRAAVAFLAVVAALASGCSSASDSSPSTSADAATPSPTITMTAPAVSDAEVEQAVSLFTAERTVKSATALVEVIDSNRSERWVPWLLDLLRADVSLQVSNDISATLEAMTGVPSTARIPDMIAYGGWAQSKGLSGGVGYVEFKASLYEGFDPAFGPLIRSVVNQTEVAAIQWGGVPLGGIPELNDPDRVPAAAATWMVDDEIVLGVTVNGEAVAYPLRILAHHELANDTIGGDDLALVYCTLCRTALVYERVIDGQRLDFLTSGLLVNSNKIMYDVQTSTLWSHLRGVGIGGELTGTKLVVRPVTHMRWGDWLAENPETEVLSLPAPIFFDNPERPPISYDYTPGQAYRSYYENPDVWFPVIDVPTTYSIKTEVVGISRNGDSVAFDVAAFTALGQTVDIDVGGDLLTVEPTGIGVRVYDETGQRVPSEQSFWFAWHANHPDTRTWEPSAN